MPVPPLRGTLSCDEADVRWAAEDFGHLVHHRPRAVLRPGMVGDVAAIVAFAARAGLSVAARGAGHSTHGQAQAAGGIVVDMTCLDQVGEVHDGRIAVQGGALWSDVLDAALIHGYTPPVLTDYLHTTTVGGTLVVGGVGGATHRHGMQVDGVTELELVAGSGRLVTCSPHRNRELFDAARGGLGQCGIIIGASLCLAPASARARCYRLSYTDLASYLADQRLLVRQGRFDHLEGQILAAGSRRWRYLIEAAAYYTPPAAPADADDSAAGLAMSGTNRSVYERAVAAEGSATRSTPCRCPRPAGALMSGRAGRNCSRPRRSSIRTGSWLRARPSRRGTTPAMPQKRSAVHKLRPAVVE